MMRQLYRFGSAGAALVPKCGSFLTYLRKKSRLGPFAFHVWLYRSNPWSLLTLGANPRYLLSNEYIYNRPHIIQASFV